MAKKQTGIAAKIPGWFDNLVGTEQLQTAAKSALSMVKTIAQYLPVKGEAGPKSDINVIDNWFSIGWQGLHNIRATSKS